MILIHIVETIFLSNLKDQGNVEMKLANSSIFLILFTAFIASTDNVAFINIQQSPILSFLFIKNQLMGWNVGSPLHTAIHLVTIWRYNSIGKMAYDQSLHLWPTQHLHVHAVEIQTLGKWHVFMTIAASLSRGVAIFPAIRWQAKSTREAEFA